MKGQPRKEQGTKEAVYIFHFRIKRSTIPPYTQLKLFYNNNTTIVFVTRSWSFRRV
jgi:hypothetical protein